MPKPLENPVTTRREREQEVALEIWAKVFPDGPPKVVGNRLNLRVGEYYYQVVVREVGKRVV